MESRSPSRILKPSLDGNESASTQSLNLRNFLNGNNVNNGVAVSFSMGGMTTRYHLRRQYDQGLPSRVSQHYTIASPHFGTAVADNVPLATRILLVGAASAVWPGWIEEDEYGYIVHHNFAPSYYMVQVLLGTPVFDAIINLTGQPALSDLEVNSLAINYINPSGRPYYENNLIRVGIVGTEIDPVIYRLAAGWLDVSEQTILDLEETVATWKFVNVVNSLIAHFEYGYPPLTTVSGFIVSYVYFININWLWKNIVLESNDSDGLVKRSSQEYPSATALYYAQFVSHMEGRNHNNVITSLTDAFNNFAPSLPPLSVNITGPAHLNQGQIGEFIANPSGGSGTYTNYRWWYRNNEGGIDPYDISGGIKPLLPPPETWIYMSWNEGQQTITMGGSFDFSIKCEVTDSDNNTATDIHSVIVGGIAPDVSQGNQTATLELVPTELQLASNYPNPFNPTTTIRFGLPEAQHVSIQIYSTIGRIVKTLVDEYLSEGFHQVVWNGRNQAGNNVASGIYIYEMRTKDKRFIKKMLLAK